jgi:hypothetical protein
MKKKVKGVEYLLNLAGEKVPVAVINPDDVRRDEFVERIFKKIRVMKRQQEWLADEIDREIREYLGDKIKGDTFQLTNYTGDKRIRYSYSEIIDFTEEIERAKQKIFDCLEKWKGTESGGVYLETLVKQTFGDKKINKTSLLKLLTTYIEDKDWVEAQVLIKKSLRIIETKRYREFQIRDSKDCKFQSINLNFNSYK